MARPRTTVPTKPADARAQRSIEALRAAFLELIELKSLEQIAIKEITETAELSYPTFFRRFASKEELLEDLATVEVDNLLALGAGTLDRNQASETAMLNMCRYIQDRRQLWTTLLTGGARNAMREEFIRVSKEFSRTRPRTNPWLPLDLATAFVASGMFEVLAWWLQQPEDYPIENVIKILTALVIDSAGRPRNISLK